jgi:hypothetical protein
MQKAKTSMVHSDRRPVKFTVNTGVLVSVGRTQSRVSNIDGRIEMSYTELDRGGDYD